MIGEKEFKKLAANSRDWLIYQLLSGRSKEIAKAEKIVDKVIEKIENPTEETTVEETIQGIVRIVTELAVQIVVGIKATWIPKSAIKNVSSVVLEQGKPVSVDLRSWFVPKMEWKVI